jgi:integrase
MTVGYTCPSIKEEENVQEILDAIIINRTDRKYWYVKYQVIFDNNTVKTLQESTKVLKNEKSQRFMQSRYLPAWILQKKENLHCKNTQEKTFEYYAKYF